MIVSTVKKTMKKALNTFALLENEAHIPSLDVIVKDEFDLLNRELIASQFLRGWFATQQKTMNTSAKDLYIVIGTLDKEIEKLHIELSNKGKKEKDLKLEEIFLEDQ